MKKFNKKTNLYLFFTIIVIISLSFVSGCNTVQPWEKGILGEPIMQFTTDQNSSIYQQHMLNSREASSGGYGGAGGGCGCK
ncbi:MAG: hypothetical protein A2539_00050 [Elusimicrobia bacterium RIFOXYD2_FULL_34_15]|nr:MAG: hypothetical protein A2539_00050 [Elusimicrobia bacterium RIFOXYD2_FULL_34_15]